MNDICMIVHVDCYDIFTKYKQLISSSHMLMHIYHEYIHVSRTHYNNIFFYEYIRN